MSTRWSIGGSVLASLCCLGPAVAALVGVGSASVLVGLTRYRWPLLAVGLAIMAVGVGLSLRRLRGACPTEQYRRYQWQVPVTALVLFGLTYGVLTYAVPVLIYQSLQPQAVGSAPSSSPMDTAASEEAVSAPASQPAQAPGQAAIARYRATLAISGMT